VSFDMRKSSNKRLLARSRTLPISSVG